MKEIIDVKRKTASRDLAKKIVRLLNEKDVELNCYYVGSTEKAIRALIRVKPIMEDKGIGLIYDFAICTAVYKNKPRKFIKIIINKKSI